MESKTESQFKPPELPEEALLRAAHERLKRMSREEFLEITVAAGIHNPDGTLTERYTDPNPETETTPLTLDELNGLVTAAILHAERIRPGTPEARSAFRHVSVLEHSIAKITPPQSLEGEIARCGAVTAALSAGRSLRVFELVKRYQAEDIRPEIRIKLDELLETA